MNREGKVLRACLAVLGMRNIRSVSTAHATPEPPGDGLTARSIQETRVAGRLTEGELAERPGLPQPVIPLHEDGLRQPSLHPLNKISSAVGRHLSLAVRPMIEASERYDEKDPEVEPLDAEVARLRGRVEAHLKEQGFHLRNGQLLAPVTQGKSELRELHAEAVATLRERSRGALHRLEDRFLERLASGDEIRPERIRPALVPILDRRGFDGLLFRWCALHWSIPVSSGYGRRIRFLIVDSGHKNKVMGLIGLADPVFALGCRDAAIGWDAKQRKSRLACVMDAFVLGAVPPYNALCGGKLAALLATSREVADAFADRYGGRTTLISQRSAEPELAMVTTTSALGRSSVYNRLTLPSGGLAFRPVGYTRGTGDFHFAGGIYQELAQYATKIAGDATQRHKRWTGTTFRNRREVIQRALDGLGFDSRKLRMHGVRRQVFIAPLAANAITWLRGEADRLEASALDCQTLGTWWLRRWALGRAERTRAWRDFTPDDWRLYT
ncbi:Druantia anti-phage system protein DruA [Micromonospora globbae]|uniref:Druantia anti-phage system protein DruA n=1 Tax=Micromonospora globbae TaxID=1894969 RepID=UPI0037AA08D5